MNKIAPLLKLLLLALAVIVFILILTSANPSGSKVSGNKSRSTGGVIIPGVACKCYCSDKCGPRDMKSGIDRPFVDSETGLCFCLPRDKANYIPNRCTPKTFANSCCG